MEMKTGIPVELMPLRKSALPTQTVSPRTCAEFEVIGRLSLLYNYNTTFLTVFVTHLLVRFVLEIKLLGNTDVLFGRDGLGEVP